MKYLILAASGGLMSVATAAAIMLIAVTLGGCAVTTVTVNNYSTVQR